MPTFAKAVASGLILVGALAAQAATDCRQRSVIVGVFDATGEPIKGLGPGKFKASYQSRQASVLFAGGREDPGTRVVVLLDASASMAGAVDSSKWKLARTAASDFLASAPAQAQISLMTFAASVDRSFEAAAGRQVMEDWLGAAGAAPPKAAAKTALYSAIVEALKKLEPSRPGDAIYVITDGGENASEIKRATVERGLVASGVRLFSFLLNDLYPGSREGTGSRELYELAQASGGMTFTVHPRGPGTGWAASGFAGRAGYDEREEKIVHTTNRWAQAAISNFYILTVAIPEASPQPEDWKLEVLDPLGKVRKDVTVAYARKLAGCGDSVPAARP